MILRKKKNPKIFCISMQRTGTTSVGQFFKDFGYKVADWPISHKNKWSFYWYLGDFERIFSSNDFRLHQVFEDDPWWLPEFYKVLYHRFPGSKFVFFTRNPDDWMESMKNHSNGMSLGNTRRHCKIYRRENEFYELFKNGELNQYDSCKIDNLLPLEGYESHYKAVYNLYKKEVVQFFEDVGGENNFIHLQLEDPEKWTKLGRFFNMEVSEQYEVHVNKSKL